MNSAKRSLIWPWCRSSFVGWTRSTRARATPEPEDGVDAYEIRDGDDLVYAGDPYEIAAEDRDDRVVRQWLREAAQNDGE